MRKWFFDVFFSIVFFASFVRSIVSIQTIVLRIIIILFYPNETQSNAESEKNNHFQVLTISREIVSHRRRHIVEWYWNQLVRDRQKISFSTSFFFSLDDTCTFQCTAHSRIIHAQHDIEFSDRIDHISLVTAFDAFLQHMKSILSISVHSTRCLNSFLFRRQNDMYVCISVYL